MTEERFTQFTLTDFVDNLDQMTKEERREGIVQLLNKAAIAAGSNTMAMLWAVIRANGGRVLVSHTTLITYDPKRITFGKQEVELGIEYTAGLLPDVSEGGMVG
jgi:hypothetical protein